MDAARSRSTGVRALAGTAGVGLPPLHCPPLPSQSSTRGRSQQRRRGRARVGPTTAAGASSSGHNNGGARRPGRRCGGKQDSLDPMPPASRPAPFSFYEHDVEDTGGQASARAGGGARPGPRGLGDGDGWPPRRLLCPGQEQCVGEESDW
ncbi:hypothetical protein PR202_ga09788 [Eleusine coracana subsp. coracana]|uniref:Uncharacterized protein n=1 Tax=Eleusine coracana subsp. coracana TaxID=191504 RepID=A0AAV5C4X5_ELECO|nr:hypothetical protein PR202_ga09788 [Eleusine coracana subsp. coracana]